MRSVLAGVFLVLLCLLPGCSTIKAIQDGVEETKKVVGELKAVYADAKGKADTNKDGVTSSDEWKTWLLGGGALAFATSIYGILKGLAAGKQAGQVSQELDELWEKTHAPKP